MICGYLHCRRLFSEWTTVAAVRTFGSYRYWICDSPVICSFCLNSGEKKLFLLSLTTNSPKQILKHFIHNRNMIKSFSDIDRLYKKVCKQTSKQIVVILLSLQFFSLVHIKYTPYDQRLQGKNRNIKSIVPSQHLTSSYKNRRNIWSDPSYTGILHVSSSVSASSPHLAVYLPS